MTCSVYVGLCIYIFLARDAFVITNHRAIAMMFVRLSICSSGTGVHCDHTVHVSADLSLWLDSPCSDTKACPPTPSRLFLVSPGTEGIWMCKNGAISQEGLNIEIMLLLSANRKSYICRVDWHNNG